MKNSERTKRKKEEMAEKEKRRKDVKGPIVILS